MNVLMKNLGNFRVTTFTEQLSRKYLSTYVRLVSCYFSLRLHGRRLRNLQVEQLLRVVLEDHFLVGVAEPLDRLDREARLVEPAAGSRVFHRADTRPLRPEQAAIDTDGLEQQLER